MRTTLSTRQLRVTPGARASIDIEITNTSDVIDGVTARIEGLDAAWVRLQEPVVSLFPSDRGMLHVELELPRSFPAGGHTVTLVIESTLDPTRRVEHEIMLAVEPAIAATMQLRPSLVNAGKRAEFGVVLTNTGNVPTEFNVVATDPNRVASCVTVPPTVTVLPGHSDVVSLHVRGPRPFFAQTAARMLQVSAITEELQLDDVARFNQKPRIPRGFLTIVILALIIALWATMFLVVVDLIRGSSAPEKVLSDNWREGGARQVLLADVAAQVSGSVSASSTGEGLARITVEAYREIPPNRAGSGAPEGTAPDAAGAGELTGSAATADDGTFRLSALLPGTYRLRFSAEGFAPVWYPDAPTAATAEPLELGPLADRTGINVEIAGRSGTLVGNVGAPPGADPSIPATVTIARVLPDGSVSDDLQTVATTGPLELTGLETPATYQVRVERPGFEPQVFTVELGGGSTTVLDTVQLAAANGSIAGLVTDGAGQPLGGVTVAIRGGEDELEVTTPTAGNVGSFLVDGLDTPRTYVLTFTLDGYSDATVALDLRAGEARGGVRATLIGGRGTVRGTAFDTDGQPLGGVAVTVASSEFTARTATLTAGTGVTGVGSFSVTDIPVPGAYTITFSLDGYLSATLPVLFLDAGLQDGIDVTLSPATGSIAGVVSAATVGLAGATVTLHDGTASRSTVTATTPAGQYSFVGLVPGWYTLTVTPAPAGVATPQPRVVLVEVRAGTTITRNIALLSGS